MHSPGGMCVIIRVIFSRKCFSVITLENYDVFCVIERWKWNKVNIM
jgi:hypothetical protein